MTERPGIELSEVLAQAREHYIAGRPEGARLHAEATRVMPGGNTRTVLYHPPFPLRVASGKHQRIVDVDGHEYVDFLGEYTAGLYGHSPEPILDAVREVLAEAGDAVVLEPAEAREAVLSAVERLRAVAAR